MSAANPVPQPDQPTQLSHDIIQFPSGHVAAIPSDLPQDSKNDIASTIYSHMQNAGQAFAGAFGLPSTGEEVSAANKQLGSQLEHPLDTAKKVATATGSAIAGMGANSQLIEKARQAWQSGDHGAAVRHMLGYLTPLVGSAGDKAGEQLESGDYGRALGTTAAAIAPLLFGKLGGSPEAGTVAEETATPKVATATETPTTAVSRVAPIQPLSDAARAAQSFIRAQRLDAGVPSSVEVEGTNVNPDEASIKVAGEASRAVRGKTTGLNDTDAQNEAARQYLNKLEKEAAGRNDEVAILHSIRQKLGLTDKPTTNAIGASSVRDVTPDAVARLKTRATTGYKYTKTEEPLATTHTIDISDAKGKPAGSINARADNTEPNNWLITGTESTQGQETGLIGYKKLMDQAEKQATESGKPVTVSGGGVQSPSAAKTWKKLESEYDVNYDKNGRPSVTFEPKVAPKPNMTAVPEWAQSLVKGKKPAAPAESIHGMVDRVMQPKSIDLTDELNAQK